LDKPDHPFKQKGQILLTDQGSYKKKYLEYRGSS